MTTMIQAVTMRQIHERVMKKKQERKKYRINDPNIDCIECNLCKHEQTVAYLDPSFVGGFEIESEH